MSPNAKLIYFSSLIFTIIIFGCVLFIMHKKAQARDSTIAVKTIKRKKKKKKSYVLSIRLYKIFTKIKVTNKYLALVYRRMEILMPGEKSLIVRKSMQTFLLAWGLSFFGVLCLILIRPRLYWVFVGLISIYFLNNMILNKQFDRAVDKLRDEFSRFIQEVRHYYYECRRIDDAIEEAAYSASPTMRGHAMLILETITAYDTELALMNYNDTAPLPELRTFTAMAVSIYSKGDKTINGASLFLMNLSYLKQDLGRTKNNKTKLKEAFSSTTIAVIAPMFLVPAIESWAMDNMPQTQSFYRGGRGLLASVICLVLTLVCYYLLDILRKGNQQVIVEAGSIFAASLNIKPIKNAATGLTRKFSSSSEKYLKLLNRVGSKKTLLQFYAERICLFIIGVVLSIFVAQAMHSANKAIQLTQTGDVAALNGASKKQVEKLQTFASNFMKEHHGEVMAVEDIREQIKTELKLRRETLITEFADVLHERLVTYNSQYLKWYEVLIALAVGLLMFFIPYWILLYQKKAILMGMNDEVIQFQSIIIMLMHLANTTSETILTWLESFAVIFKPALAECLTNLNKNESEAFDTLIAKEPFPPFKEIVQNLAIADKVGVEKAFEEVSADRQLFQTEIQTDLEISINKKKVYATLIAFIPGVFVFVAYLLIPFVLEGFGGLFGMDSNAALGGLW